MRNLAITASSAAALVCACALAGAAEFEVRILWWPPEMLLYAPMGVAVEARNVSGHPVTVANGAFSFRVYTRTSPTAEWDTCPRRGAGLQPQFARGHRVETLPTGWHRVMYANVSCVVAPADLEVQAVVRSYSKTGRYPGLPPDQPGEFEAWTGEVKSEIVHIKVVAPAGVDFEAYEYFKGSPYNTPRLGELLQNFPTSTYAAYAVREYSHAGGLGWHDAQYAMGEAVRCPQLSVPCIHGHCEKSGGLETIYGDAMAAWREKWCDIVLKAHPDAWFADELRFLRAANQIALNNPAEAKRQLEALAEKGGSGIPDKAASFLALVKQKGLIK